MEPVDDSSGQESRSVYSPDQLRQEPESQLVMGLIGVARDLREHLGHPPTKSELSRQLGLDQKELPNFWLLNAIFWREEPIEIGLDVSQEVRSQAVKKLAGTIWQIFGPWLNDRQKQVIKVRFGLETGEPVSLRVAGKIIGLSGERVRLIEREAVRRLSRLVYGERFL